MGRKGNLHDVPELPKPFLRQKETFNQTKDLLSAKLRTLPSSQVKIGIHGMGGSGKSVFAADIAQDQVVRQIFTDGIFWISVGTSPNILQRQSDLAVAFGGEPYVKDIESGKRQLRELLGEKKVLLILDDVWEIEHCRAFEVIGALGGLVVTTRDSEIITAFDGTKVLLESFSDEQALSLLAQSIGSQRELLPVEAQQVAQECGNLPLALAISAALVKDGVSWDWLLGALKEAELEYLEHQDRSVFKSLKVSIDKLNEDEKEAYLRFAVLPDDTPVPCETILNLWQYANKMREYNAKRLLARFESRSLLKRTGTLPKQFIELHDLQLSFLRVVKKDCEEYHKELLESYKKQFPNGWHTGLNDGYYFEQLPWHFHKAKIKQELYSLLFDYKWIQAKLNRTNPLSLLMDYDLLDEGSEDVLLLKSAFNRAEHILVQDKKQLPSWLWGQLADNQSPRIQLLLNECKEKRQGFVWLRPITPSLKPISDSLEYTVKTTVYRPGGMAIASDSEHILITSSKPNVQILSLKKRKLVRTLQCKSTKAICAVGIIQNTEIAVTASYDGIIELWNLKSWKQEKWFDTQTEGIQELNITPDGKQVVATYYDGGYKIWSLESERLLFTIPGKKHECRQAVVTPDGNFIVAITSYNTIEIWNLKTRRREPQSIRSEDDAFCSVIVVPEENKIVAASRKVIKIWDFDTCEFRQELSAHTEWINFIKVFPDMACLISVSKDKTIKFWEFETWKCWETLPTASKEIVSVVFQKNSEYVLSLDSSGILKIWNIKTHSQERVSNREKVRSINTIAISPDANQVVGDVAFNTVAIWTLNDGKQVDLLKIEHLSISAIVWTKSGIVIAGTNYSDNQFEIWNLNKKQQISIIPNLSGQHIYSVKCLLTPEAKLVAYVINEDTSIYVWDIEDQKQLSTLTGHAKRINALAVMPNNNQMISVADNEFRIWDLRTCSPLNIFKNPFSFVTAMAVLPDGKKLVLATLSDELIVCSPKLEKILIRFKCDCYFWDCAVSPDGKTIVATDSLGRVHFLKLEEH